MRKFNELSKCQKNTRIYLFYSALLFLSLLAMCFCYVNQPKNWKLWFIVANLILIIVGTIVYFVLDWGFQVKELMNEYKEKNNLMSGGMGYFMAFSLPVIIIVLVSSIPDFPEYMRNAFTVISGLLIAAMPALIGLLGVQHSVAIQENNRKDDLRRGAKPFLSVNCSQIKLLSDNEKSDSHRMRMCIEIKNLTDNIAMLSKIVSVDSANSKLGYIFNYYPLAKDQTFVDIIELESDMPYSDFANFIVHYMDIYKNEYLLSIELSLKSKSSTSDIKMLSDLLTNN